MKHEVKWRGERYYLSELDDNNKAKFCKCVYDLALANARKVKSASDYFEFERRLTVKLPEWTSVPSSEVAEAMKTELGLLALLRVLMDLSDDAADKNYMSNEDLTALMTDKEDNASDLQVAIRLVQEAAGPKVQRDEHTLPVPKEESEPTSPLATSPST